MVDLPFREQSDGEIDPVCVEPLDPLPPSDGGILVAPGAFAGQLLDAVSGR